MSGWVEVKNRKKDGLLALLMVRRIVLVVCCIKERFFVKRCRCNKRNKKRKRGNAVKEEGKMRKDQFNRNETCNKQSYDFLLLKKWKWKERRGNDGGEFGKETR